MTIFYAAESMLHGSSLIQSSVSWMTNFWDRNILRGSVATRLRCDGIFNNHCTANLLKKICQWKNFNNPLRSDVVTAMSFVSSFFRRQRKKSYGDNFNVHYTYSLSHFVYDLQQCLILFKMTWVFFPRCKIRWIKKHGATLQPPTTIKHANQN